MRDQDTNTLMGFSFIMTALATIAVLISSACVSPKWKAQTIQCVGLLQQATPVLEECRNQERYYDLRIKTCDDEVARLMKEKADKLAESAKKHE